VILATTQEDAGGIDFWVKMPGDMRLFPIQISQLGTSFFRTHKTPSRETLNDFIKAAEIRIAKKRARCRRDGVAFLLVRDFSGERTTEALALSDVRALWRSLVKKLEKRRRRF